MAFVISQTISLQLRVISMREKEVWLQPDSYFTLKNVLEITIWL
jgi:hypothetical protein